jgi:hypothetical protein
MKNRTAGVFGVAIFLIMLMIVANSCSSHTESSVDESLYDGFKSPPAEARPFVRWWWNGNKIEADEIDRELKLLKEAGFGGVEINPIAFPDQARETGVESKVWMSEEWVELLLHACTKAGEHEMIADLIVGSGWPFGGEFLGDDEIIQMVIPHQILIENDRYLSETTESLIERVIKDLSTERSHVEFNENYPPTVLFATLMPLPLNGIDDVVDLSTELLDKGRIQESLNPGLSYMLSYGILQRGHRSVMHGAPGAAGPVMDHYNREVTLAYLSRLKAISEQTGIPLSEIIRALFCDSIELAGSNWTQGLADQFRERYGYDLDKYLPFVFTPQSENLDLMEPSAEMSDQIKRARYDFNRLLVDVFLENFTGAFQEFCTSEGLQCRYQAYGVPFLMGMLEGFMIPDIPESNNWIYSTDMDAPSWEWNMHHGYMVWNMYAASGGHLKGRKIISCESMTNTQGVFKASLEEIKQHDDMNFITGINHSILHGFNYSPPEAGFPGWIRYGAYFSEQNPWWPYLHKWVDYNARLSFIFQNSKPQKSIAIMGPTADLWSEVGLIRQPFHVEPWYLHQMWQPISQAGYGAEYLNERVIQNAVMSEGLIEYGPMSYSALILANVRSMDPETALKIADFVKSGGQLVIVDQIPERSTHMANAGENDQMVKELFEKLLSTYPELVVKVESASEQTALNPWTYELLGRLNVQAHVEIADPDPDVYQIHTTAGPKQIYFFTNVHRKDSAVISARFPGAQGVPYVWDPESGDRWKFLGKPGTSGLKIELPPLKSLLLVFEEEVEDMEPYPTGEKLSRLMEQDLSWDVKGEHMNGSQYQWKLTALKDLARSSDPEQNSFAGRLIYSTSFENQGHISHLDLGETHRGITQVLVNGEEVGLNWYGEALFKIDPYLKEGTNSLEIIYTTVLANYCIDLDDPVAAEWTGYQEKVACGIEGPVWFMH